MLWAEATSDAFEEPPGRPGASRSSIPANARLYKARCNGPRIVNPFLRHPLANQRTFINIKFNENVPGALADATIEFDFC
jgi:hypothetical protein